MQIALAVDNAPRRIAACGKARRTAAAQACRHDSNDKNNVKSNDE
jgi:hypothetical protein